MPFICELLILTVHSPCNDAGRFVSETRGLTPHSREQKYEERCEAQATAHCVQCGPAPEWLLGEFGVFV